MKDDFRKWQAAWHDLFDQDQTLAATGEFDRTSPLSDDPIRDSRLVFGLSLVEPATRAA